MENPKVLDLVKEINDYCSRKYIVGFHFTPAIFKEIAAKGLKCRTGSEIRRNFLVNYSKLFTQHELDKIKKEWDTLFHIRNQQVRDNRLCFNFTTNALNDNRVDSLLNNFGG